MADNPSTGSVVTPTSNATRCQVIPYPKIVFFYPLMFTALICALIQYWAPDKVVASEKTKLYVIHTTDINKLEPGTVKPEYLIAVPEKPVVIEKAPKEKDDKVEKNKPVTVIPITKLSRAEGINTIAGSIFLLVFLINILVISFDFPGLKALTLGLFGLCIFLGLLYMDWLGPIGQAMQSLSHTFYASWTFYAIVSGIIFLMIISSIVYNRIFNQWIVESSRLLHRHGFFGEFTEYPVVDLQMDKEIDDVFEYMLLFSGTLIFRPNPTTPPIRLENIPLIKSKERRIRNIIRKISVKEE